MEKIRSDCKIDLKAKNSYFALPKKKKKIVKVTAAELEVN